MAKNTSRKTVFFIVEGKTDKTALEKIFQAIYKHKDINFAFTGGDVTSDELIGESDVENILYKLVDDYMKDKKVKKSDIWQIVHIFDMDGAYIPESAIVEGDSYDFVYTESNISCSDIDRVKERNTRKKKMMEYLLSLQYIKGIPYQCFFMSSNLDHALYDEMNLSKQEKKIYADAFYDLFLGQEKTFIDFLETDAVNGVPDSFPASWRYIKEELHSLERHTNLHIYFKQNPYE